MISADPVEGEPIIRVDSYPLSPTRLFQGLPSYDPNITIAYDCYARCIADPTCVYIYFAQNPVPYDSYYDSAIDTEVKHYAQCVWASFDTCDVAANSGYYIRGSGTSKLVLIAKTTFHTD